MPRWTLLTGECHILQQLEAKQHKGSQLKSVDCWFIKVHDQTALRLYVSLRLVQLIYKYKHVRVVCSPYLFFLCCSDMNNRSIAWWLRQNGLSQYTKILESEYYGLEVCECLVSSSVFCYGLYSQDSTLSHCSCPILPDIVSSQGLLNVTDGELRDAGVEDATHRQTILDQLSRHRQRLEPHSGNKGNLIC